jgi:hypothetical protein
VQSCALIKNQSGAGIKAISIIPRTNHQKVRSSVNQVLRPFSNLSFCTLKIARTLDKALSTQVIHQNTWYGFIAPDIFLFSEIMFFCRKISRQFSIPLPPISLFAKENDVSTSLREHLKIRKGIKTHCTVPQQTDINMNEYGHHHHHHHHHHHEEKAEQNKEPIRTLTGEPVIVEEGPSQLKRPESSSDMSTSSSTSCGDFDSNGSEYGESVNINKLHERLPEIVKRIAELLQLDVIELLHLDGSF